MGMDMEGTSRLSNSLLNRQAYGAAMAQKALQQGGGSGNMNNMSGNLNNVSGTMNNANMTSSSINNLTSISASSNASGRSGASRSSMAQSLQGASGAECRRFTPVQVHKATEGYSQANVLGHGAFGTVSVSSSRPHRV